MRVTIVFNAPEPDADASQQDVLTQVEAVQGSLRRLGHEVSRLACTLDLDVARRELQTLRPDRVFNLVESLAGSDRFQVAIPVWLESMAIPYTGASGRAMRETGNKPLAKERLSAAGLPTPAWLESDFDAPMEPTFSAPPGEESCRSLPSRSTPRPLAFQGGQPRTVIVKPIWEHASLGMDDHCVATLHELPAAKAFLQAHERTIRCPCFLEEFVDGQEFNLSVLTGGQVLPPAEIEFHGFPLGKPRIVGYRAKWDESSPEYAQTTRRFEFNDADQGLLHHLAELARACWSLFELRGWARIDFRVDEQGQPWILEINANPCLSPDAGFAAALAHTGIPFDVAISRILDDVAG